MAQHALHAGESMTAKFSDVPGFWQRLRALIRKEFNQIRRDRRLAVALIVPPILQILLFGFALDSTVSNLRLGILDESKTPESRELVASFTESKSFKFGGYFFDGKTLEESISRGNVDAGLVIPYDFARDLHRGRNTSIQFLLNAVNANNAAIGQGYAEGVLANYNQLLGSQGIHPQIRMVSAQQSLKGLVNLRPAYMFNPGLVTTWFIVTGTFGTLLILNGSLVASTAMIKERERGTVEQLLMTPAGTTEIILAKITPLFLLLIGMVLLAMTIIRTVFQVPFRGSFLLVFAGSALCVLCGIGIGTFIATFTRSAQQSQLLSFFVNPPLATLSGSLSPIEAMPKWLQPFTIVNPIRHFGVITRGVMVKGSGLLELWPNFLALIAFAVVLVSLSVWRFRKQLG
jgi:ABC-2 type transport system permease protein